MKTSQEIISNGVYGPCACQGCERIQIPCPANITKGIEEALAEGRRAALSEAIEIVEHQQCGSGADVLFFRRICSATLFLLQREL